MLDMWIGGSVPGMEAAGLSATRREPVPGGSEPASCGLRSQKGRLLPCPQAQELFPIESHVQM